MIRVIIKKCCRWRFSDAVGIVIRVQDADGKLLPDELLRTTQVSQLTVELDVGGRTRVREQKMENAGKLMRAGGGGEETLVNGQISDQTQMVIRVLQRHFPTMIHAFAVFDSDDGNEVHTCWCARVHDLICDRLHLLM